MACFPLALHQITVPVHQDSARKGAHTPARKGRQFTNALIRDPVATKEMCNVVQDVLPTTHSLCVVVTWSSKKPNKAGDKMHFELANLQTVLMPRLGPDKRSSRNWIHWGICRYHRCALGWFYMCANIRPSSFRTG
jgi:hypothetical protein